MYHLSIWMIPDFWKDVEIIDETPFLCFHMSWWQVGYPGWQWFLPPRCQPSAGWSGWDWILRARGWREMNDGFDVEHDFKGDRFELCSISNMISHISYIYDIYHIYLYHIVWYLSHLYNIPTFAAWMNADRCHEQKGRDMHVLFLFLGNRYSNSRCCKERFESLWDAEHVSVHPGNWRGPSGVWSDPSKTDVKFWSFKFSTFRVLGPHWVQARSILEKNNQVGHWTYAVGFVAIFEWRKIRVPLFWNTASWNTCHE